MTKPVRVTLRPAVSEDLDAVVAIERQSFTDPPWSRASFTALVDSPRAFFTVACSAAALIGYVVSWLVGDEAEVANLAVAPEWRGQGVGAALLDAALAEMRRGGAHVAHLEVRDSNLPARALYGSRGFTPVGRRRRYYQAPVEDAVLLRCDLRPIDGAERQSEA
ncbi:MAG TPA: ribosomal protein S18-alanine N-acetyltransferase [Gemmatimonadaceae bacterium]|jgi:ribosomal-protein-alanine N-acetyltransferase|nr:ribosomal protein S18-alanine N-acetyltransferase [Gemmatimonadaceae bacterium]